MKTSTWLWTGVAVGFLLLACAWTAMFHFARQAHVQSVPLTAPAPQTSAP